VMQVTAVTFGDSPLPRCVCSHFLEFFDLRVPVTSVLAITLGTVLIVWVSRRSLIQPSSHGFPRFFAFEAILVLVVINAPLWLVHPLAMNQIVSWLLLAASLVTLVAGIVLLRRHGDSKPSGGNAALYGWENTTRLITDGIYRYIRHPMYASLLFLAWGAAFKSLGIVTVSLALTASVAIFLTSTAEERENLASFGDAYRTYIQQTKRFVPFLF